MADVIKTRKCPICGKIAPEGKYRPFCSKRCADIDLGHWFDGYYAVAAQELDESDYEELVQAMQPSEDEKQ